MATVLLIIHVLIALALIGIVLLQRSEGGALGIGGGGGGFMTGRGTANFLTRVTAGLAAAFFTTSLLLSVIASQPQGEGVILDTPAATTTKAPPKGKPPGGQTTLPEIKLPGDAPLETPKPETTPPRVPQSK
jgi:preprotein translocase subunit SecG